MTNYDDCCGLGGIGIVVIYGNFSEALVDYGYNWDSTGQGVTVGNESYFLSNESIIGSGAIDHYENDTSRNSPEADGPLDKWPFDTKPPLEAIEAVSRDLETGMAGPFLTQSSTEHNTSGSFQCSDAEVFESDCAPEGTCCASHRNFECFFEISDSDSGDSATVSKR